MSKSTAMNEIIKGYKATDKNMRCRRFQFELGKWHKHDGEIAMCESGFHFCEYSSGPWSFYSGEGTRIFKVEARGVIRGEGPGADLKHVAMEIRLVEEITPNGDGNTGHRNTGHRNTGDGNTGDRNTGDGNTGGWNTGGWNTGYGNTGHRNTGDGNTGDRNTGDGNTGGWNTGGWNTGYGNTGHRNTGYGNVGDRHSGFFCKKTMPVLFFDKPAKTQYDESLVYKLSMFLAKDEPFEIESWMLEIPNATEKAIKDLHKAHIKARSRQ
jgi:hypothetical protein